MTPRRFAVAAALVLLGALGCSNGDPAQTEAPCTADGGCAAGVCIDLHGVDGRCESAAYCSSHCKAIEECTLGGEQGACVGADGGAVCVYPSWRSLHGCE